MTSTQTYRRRLESFTWHYREDCKRFPTEDYVEEKLNTSMEFQMVCVICKRKEKEEKGFLERPNQNN